MRVGFGYDVHPFAEGEDLILGGVEIPFSKGLKGHSDADTLVHAIIDALLGAAGLEDIGSQFPDTDPKYKDISSLLLLEKVKKILVDKSYQIENIDSTIVIENPKMKEHIPKMRSNIAASLQINEDKISIKATKEEKLGFVGKNEGIKVFAVTLLNKN